MPMFRLRTDDGAEQTLQATRVVSDDDTTCFQSRVDGQWQPVLEVRTSEVVGILRRVNELDGRWTWVTQRPQPISCVPTA